MKNYFAFIFLLLFVSCEDNNVFEDVINTESQIGTVGELQTRATETSPVFNWEKVNSIKMNIGGSSIPVTLPWYNGAISQLPFNIIADYKEADGWVMFYNYISSKQGLLGANYLAFYNIFTGVMRVFYYNNYDVTNASTTFWTVKLQESSALLNSAGYFTDPSSIKQSVPEYYTSNISMHPTKSINRGWNCFDIEFTYDPDFDTKKQNQHMSIGAYDVTTSKVNLEGDIELSSQGTIVSTTKSNSVYQNILNTGVKAAGTSAEKLIKEKLIGKDNKSFFPNLGASAIASIAGGGITEFVNAGINLAFGSFLGKKNKTTTQTLKVKTTGKFTITGTIESNSSSNITALSNLLVPGARPSSVDNFLPSFNETFGSWNLAKAPVIDYSDESLFFKQKNAPSYTPYNYIQQFYLNTSSVDVKINPYIEDKLERYTVSTSLVYYKKFQGGNELTKCYSTPLRTERYSVGGTTIFKDETKGIETEIILNPSPRYPEGRPLPVLAERWNTKYNTVDLYCKRSSNIPIGGCAVKVTVTFYPKYPYDTDPIVSTRTYLPVYNKTYGKLDYYKEYF